MMLDSALRKMRTFTIVLAVISLLLLVIFRRVFIDYTPEKFLLLSLIALLVFFIYNIVFITVIIRNNV